MQAKDLKLGEAYAYQTRDGWHAHKVIYHGPLEHAGLHFVTYADHADPRSGRGVPLEHIISPWADYERAETERKRTHDAEVATHMADARAIASVIGWLATEETVQALAGGDTVTLTLDDLRALVRAALRGAVVLTQHRRSRSAEHCRPTPERRERWINLSCSTN